MHSKLRLAGVLTDDEAFRVAGCEDPHKAAYAIQPRQLVRPHPPSQNGDVWFVQLFWNLVLTHGTFPIAMTLTAKSNYRSFLLEHLEAANDKARELGWISPT